MGLMDRPVVDPGWFEAVRRPSRGFETAIIEIIDPETTFSTPYDPATGLGGDSVPSVVWPVVPGFGDQPFGEGPYGGSYVDEEVQTNAWVEIINSSRGVGGAPQPTDVTSVHVHIDLDKFGSTEGIRTGFQIRVLDGHRDKVLEHRVIVIQKTTTGNMAVQRTLECIIDEKAYI